jgi:hypothetical protein
VIEYPTVHEALRAAIPEFSGEIDEHFASNEEMLQHVLFGDFTRFVMDAQARGDEELVRRCLAFLEEALRDGDKNVVTLVQVSFVENVGPFIGDVAEFVETWPTALRAEAQRQRDWKRGDPGPFSVWGSA